MIYIYKYDEHDHSPVKVKASFNHSFNKSFNTTRRPKYEQIVLIPRNLQTGGALQLSLHNVAENTDTSMAVEDMGGSKDYYRVKVTGIPTLATGEYIYTLTAGGQPAGEGLAMVVGHPLVWKEEQENIEFNEYGNRR